MDLVRKIVVSALLVAAYPAAAADRGFYFGVIGGTADYEFNVPQFFQTFQVSPAPIVTLPPGSFFGNALGPVFFRDTWQPGDDDESTTWGVVAGYRIIRYAAVELNYLNLGTLKESETVLLFSSGTAQLNRELETTGTSISALGILPLRERWSVYLRAGVLFADMQFTSSLDSPSSTRFGSESFLWGAGTQFDWGKHWSVRADFQRFNAVGEITSAGQAGIDLLSLGVLFRL